mmetsp:Transcript_6143/g.14022  ORF Transcript_6143/g.14022 Transcript_6143/m.14022 type:complete len:269 (+) Transcript_6143:391-1197(+)
MVPWSYEQSVPLPSHVGQRAAGDDLIEAPLDGLDAGEPLRVLKLHLAVVKAKHVEQRKELLVRLETTSNGPGDELHLVLVLFANARCAQHAARVVVDVVNILQSLEHGIGSGLLGSVAKADTKAVNALAIAHCDNGAEVVDTSEAAHAAHAVDVKHVLAHLPQIQVGINPLLFLDVDLAPFVPERVRWLSPLPLVAPVLTFYPLHRTSGAVEVQLLLVELLDSGPLSLPFALLLVPVRRIPVGERRQALAVVINQSFEIHIIEIRVRR